MSRRSRGKVSFLVKAAAFVILVGGIRVAAGFLTPILLGLFFAILFAPLHHFFLTKRVPAAVSLLLIIVMVLAGGLGLYFIVSRTAVQFSHNMPTYGDRLAALMDSLSTQLKGFGVNVNRESLDTMIPTGAMVSFASGFLARLGAMISQMALVMLIAIFLLLELRQLPARLGRAFPGKHDVNAQYEEIAGKVRHYIGIKALISFITGLLITVWTLIFGLDFPLFWGLLAFLMNFIPNIGSVLAAIPAVVLALITLGPGGAALVGLGYLLVNIVLGNIIEPKVMGRGVGLSSAVVFLSMLFWGWVLGPVGMFLSVPLTAMVKIVLESDPATRGVASLLGELPDPTPATGPVRSRST